MTFGDAGRQVTTKFNAAFWRWFGNSVVVSPDGSPRVVYHGTNPMVPAFTAFRLPKEELGIHFGTADQASLVSGRGGRIYPLYASIQNPLRMKDMGTWYPYDLRRELQEIGVLTREEEREIFMREDHALGIIQIRAALTRAGYDAIVYRNIYEAKDRSDATTIEDSYVVWNPAQIKSATGNRGTWDFNDPDILSGLTAFGGLRSR